jgi:ribosomal protein L10
MALSKEKKSQILDGLRSAISGSKSIAFVHAKGLSVADTNILRSNLRAND